MTQEEREKLIKAILRDTKKKKSQETAIKELKGMGILSNSGSLSPNYSAS